MHPGFFKDLEVSEDYEPMKNFVPGFRDNLVLLVCSFFNGADLFHVLSRLNWKTRNALPKAGLVDQEKMLTVKPTDNLDNIMTKIKYGLSLANTVNFCFNGTFTSERDLITDYYNLIFGAICGFNE